MYQRILLTLDESELSEQALPSALNFAKAYNAELEVLCVVPPPTGTFNYQGEPPSEGEQVPPLAEQFVETELARTQDYLNAKVRELRKSGVNASGISLEGPPADVIIHHANQQKVDLIVMATHGRSGFARLAFGSVAEQVLRGAGVPLLLVRAAKEK